MVRTRKMNEAFFVSLQKDLTAAGELIRARQDEKQSLLDEFDSESKRFFFGRISEKALAVSVKKTNTELQRLDKSIRETMARCRDLSSREMKLVSAQAPIGFRASLSGVVNPGGKKVKKGKTKKRVVKRKKESVKKVKRKAVKKKTVKRTVKKKPRRLSIPNMRRILRKEKKLDKKFTKKKKR